MLFYLENYKIYSILLLNIYMYLFRKYFLIYEKKNLSEIICEILMLNMEEIFYFIYDIVF